MSDSPADVRAGHAARHPVLNAGAVRTHRRMVEPGAVKDAVRLPSALLFDVFGTVVDWRTGVARDVGRVARRHGVRVDPAAFADAWRAEYRPAMDRVRTGAIPWHALDALHRSSLDRLLVRFKLRL